LNFDGAGHFKGAYTGNFSNAVVKRSFAGTYAVHPDGTGSLVWTYSGPPPQSQESYDFILVDGGKEMFCVYTTQAPAAPWVGTMIMKKQ
jgi:hypothetical protein